MMNPHWEESLRLCGGTAASVLVLESLNAR